MLRFTFSILFFTVFQSFTQDTIPAYEVQNIPGIEVVKLPMNFDGDEFITNETIIKVDYIYSTYRLDPHFDQVELNQKRILKFKQKLNQSTTPLTEWNTFAQSGSGTVNAAKKLFHGFVVYYRSHPTSESIEEEINFIDEIVFGEAFGFDDIELESEIEKTSKKDHDVKTVVSESFNSLSAHNSDCYELFQKGIIEKTPEEFNAFYSDKMKSGNFQIVYSSTKSRQHPTKSKYTFSLYKKKVECMESYTVLSESGKIPIWLNHADYHVVQAAFERNHQWQNSIVVMDITGSMSPYIAQTMAWVKASHDSSQISSFVFFNDGDQTPDHLKKKGNVHGIYMAENKDFKTVYRTMKYTMKKGGGGDAPENNVEASIRGILHYPKCDEVIMIADNWATPRDLSILHGVKKPIHVILCGALQGININYLQLAYETGGSIHTIEEDLEMRNIEVGKQFQIGDTYYTLLDGRIVNAKHR